MPKVLERPVDVKSMSPFDRFCYFIMERESVRLKKEAGESKPWTADPILRAYRFCNIRRMDDRVSDWLLTNWYKPYFDNPNMLVACLLARLFNKPETLVHLTGQIFGEKNGATNLKLDVVRKTIQHLKGQGKTVFNGAYIVSTNGLSGDKVDVLFDHLIGPFVDNLPKLGTNSMQRSVEALTKYWGLSTFLGGQIVADMRWAIKGTWEDRMVWAPVGPGSRRGMNRLHSRDAGCGLGQAQFLKELRQMINDCTKAGARLGLAFRDAISRLEAQDWQNCLCEYDKMCRTLNGEGRPKQKYPGA